MSNEQTFIHPNLRDMNAKRAAWASIALAAFCAVTGQNSVEEVEEAIIDLICDLLHLANAHDLDPSRLVTWAIGHYEHEVLCPDDEFMMEHRCGGGSSSHDGV